MEISHDKEADLMYIKFRNVEFVTNKKIDDFTIIDYDKDNNTLGIELISVSKRIPQKSLPELSVKNIAVMN